jgi:hypothetical protein
MIAAKPHILPSADLPPRDSVPRKENSAHQKISLRQTASKPEKHGKARPKVSPMVVTLLGRDILASRKFKPEAL